MQQLGEALILVDDLTLANMAKAGDNQAMEQLINRYKALVRQKASAMFMLGADGDDVIQEGMIGLFKAIRDFQPTQGVLFATFANRCVAAQIIDAVRQASRQKHRPLNESLSLQTLLGSDPLGLPTEDRDIAATDENPEQSLLSREESDRLHDYLKQELSELEQLVIRLYLKGHSYREIALALNCTTKRIDNALTRTRRKLAQFYQQKATKGE
ncbi:MAG: sigma-70 family RNA polymerase sigma factor [Eubacteriales bacterium]|nr:sigma-70 family RNA polymerase sigma factor [Eubacteriales bacterium]